MHFFVATIASPQKSLKSKKGQKGDIGAFFIA
jgi:hypothetical protein